MKQLIIILIAGLIGVSGYTQFPEPYVDVYFVLIHASKDYDQARDVAEGAHQKLGLKLALGGNYPSAEEGLTNDLICDCGVSHGYIPRGREGNNNYISVEFSSAFNGFSEGYYIVVIAQGDRDHAKEYLSRAKEHYADAYIKKAPVYMGCMH